MTEANLEWHVTYVEASLPAAEIAGATRQKRTRAVALSLVYPKDDSRLESELALLDDYLKPEVVIVVGGLLAQRCKGKGVKGSVLDIVYSPPSFLRRYRRWFR